MKSTCRNASHKRVEVEKGSNHTESQSSREGFSKEACNFRGGGRYVGKNLHSKNVGSQKKKRLKGKQNCYRNSGDFKQSSHP